MYRGYTKKNEIYSLALAQDMSIKWWKCFCEGNMPEPITQQEHQLLGFNFVTVWFKRECIKVSVYMSSFYFIGCDDDWGFQFFKTYNLLLTVI